MTTIANNLSQNGLFGNVIRPQAIVRGGKLYVVYGGPSEDVYILRCNPDGSSVEGPYLVGTNPLPLGDAHGAPSIWFDGQGRANVFGGCHVSPMKWWRANAGEITGWQAQADFAGVGTYPSIHNYSGAWASWAKMVYRGASGWNYRYTSDGGNVWSQPGTLAAHGAAFDSLYYDYGQGEDGSDHYCGCWYDKNNTRGVQGSALEYLHDFFYYYSPPTGGYKKTSGEALPANFIASPENYGANIRVVDSGTVGMQIPCMEIYQSQPHVVLTRGNGTQCEIVYGRIVNGAWAWEVITNCDDITDCGSLKVLSDRVVVLLTRGGTGGSSTVLNARRGGNIEQWERLNSTGQWVSQGTILTAEPPLYWNQPVAVYGADAFIVGQQYDWPAWDASDKTWSGGRIELITLGSTPPPPPPPPVETWKRTGSLNEALAAGSPVRAVNGVVESTHSTWSN